MGVPWRYHSGLQALIFTLPEMNGKAVAFPTKSLREAGWKADDIQLLRVLPRADESRLAGPQRPR